MTASVHRQQRAGTNGNVRQILSGLYDFLLPPACASCRQPLGQHDAGLICRTCWSRAVRLIEPVCSRCGHPRLSPGLPRPRQDDGTPGELPPCRWCPRLPSYVRAARSYCRVDTGTGSAIVHALKYGGWRAVAPAMAAHMARLSFPADVVAERTAVIAVPLSLTRLRERGYNQAGELAASLSQEWKLPAWGDILVRTRNTRSQVQLTPSERAHNVSNAFSVVKTARAQLKGAHVVLVDDVITTAATLNAAAAALADGGVRIISYVSFGRAPDPGDHSDADLHSDA